MCKELHTGRYCCHAPAFGSQCIQTKPLLTVCAAKHGLPFSGCYVTMLCQTAVAGAPGEGRCSGGARGG